YVFNGSSSGLPLSPNWTFEPNQAEAYCGFAVSSAGDVNGDGYSDVLVGAPLYDNRQFDEGRAFVFNGSDTGLSGTASWAGEPDQVQAIYGSALSSAGDVNGDGYSDIIVGAYGFDNGHTDEGRAYVYYGNEGTSMRSTVQQFKPGSSDIVYSGGLTGTNGQVKLNLFGRSPFGRADGKIVYEVMPNGVPFSGANISNSTSFTGSGNITDMGTALSGVQLNGEVSGLPINKEYKWRARVQYSPVNNPYQKFGPWKYYTNYIPQPFGCFKAQNSSLQVSPVPGTILLMSQGMFVNSGSYWSMADTIRIQFRQNVSPYAIVDSAKSVIGNSSYVMYDVLFNNAVSGTYYIVIKHRNSIETWSNSAENYERGSSFFKTFVIPGAAYGDNTIQLIQSETWRGIYSGDENQNGVVDLTDVVNVSNAGSSFTTGYVPADMNGDNVVDLSDLVITSNNASAFVSAVTP
ncbi:MAG: FG-GAP repeat protein, partial [Ignavibacteriae bacterium]|nr:FG-GAP repeat protein [Ignavibacteriota bacterium]